MKQDEPHKTTSGPGRKPIRKRRSHVLMCYVCFAGVSLAAVAVAWLTVWFRNQNGPLGALKPGDAWVYGAFSVLLFLLAIMFLLTPTLWEQFPSLRPENQGSNETLNAWMKRNTRPFRKEAFRNAPVFQRRLIRFCLWAPYIILALLSGLHILNYIVTLPSLLVSIDAAIDQYGTMPLVLALIIPSAVAYELLMRRAVLNLERENRRRELYPDTCPECDYPIDPDHQSSACPECGYQ